MKNKNQPIALLTIIFIYFLTANLAHAQILISEIMYDPEGTDTGREWIELYNSSAETIDLTTHKVFEENVSHKIALYGNKPTTINAGGYAIIADNAEKFLTDYPNFSGTLLDSVFSLKNTGEQITITNASGTETDSFEYTPEIGGINDGNSLQLLNNIFIQAKATPGEVNTDEAIQPDEDEEEDDTTSSSDTSTHESTEEVSTYVPKVDFKIYAGRDRYGSINTPITFEMSHNLDKNTGVKGYWSMGDGERITGKNIEYEYDRAGTYNVVLNARYDSKQAISRLKVYISEPNLEIFATSTDESGKTVDIMFKNKSNREVNLGHFVIENNSESFEIPQDTIISPNISIYLQGEKTGIDNTSPIRVLYPNGDILWKAVDNFVNIASNP